MGHVCRTCSRVNPPEAQFCYFDGVALDVQHQGGPVAAGAKLFPTPFVFPSGRQCRNFDELARACDAAWDAGVELLREGYFDSFLGGLGRTDLALAARQAAKEADRDRGLDQFLNTLPVSNREPAKLVVQPQEINLGQIDGERRFVIHLENQGDALLTGTIAGHGTNWLAFGDAPGVPRKFFQCRHDGAIPVHVVGKNVHAGNKAVEGRILIESNGGTTTVQVRVERAVQPFPEGVLAGAKLPREVAAKAKANPKEAARLFEKGAVKAWYEANGWTYPVQGPSSSGLGAIQQFFEALGLVQAPKVTISHEKIQFEGKPGEFLEQTIRVQTAERRPVYAHATTTAPWLQIGKPVYGGRTVTIPIRVPSNPAMPGDRLHATIQVTSNGNQRFTVEVELTIAGSRATRQAVTTVPVLEIMDALTDAPQLELVPEPPLALAIEPEVVATEPAPVVVPVAAAYVETLEVVPAVVPTATNPAIVDVLPAAVPVLEAVPAPGAAAPRPSGWPWSAIHALPVFLLMFFLFVPCMRDGVWWLFKRPAQPAAPTEPEIVAPGVPRLELRFHDHEEEVRLGIGGVKPTQGNAGATRPAFWEPSMRFGVLQIADDQGRDLPSPKRLTFREEGTTNNAVVRLDGHEWLFGERPFRLADGKTVGVWPGRWRERDQPLPDDDNGGQRFGRQSVWVYDQQKIAITQIVELVAGVQSGVPDTVLVRYVLANEDQKPHRVGLRFLLDTFIGDNDGVPFLIPGQEQLCTTSMVFADPRTMPDFIQAREFEDLSNPGTIAQVQLKVGGGLEAPSRVTLGAWPNIELNLKKIDARCVQEKTMWEVPVLPIHTLTQGDSAVVLYWNERELAPGEQRQVGFAYGLGQVSGGEGQGKLAVTVGGSFVPEGEFTVTAYVSNPAPGQTVTLSLPDEFEILGEPARRNVPMPSVGATTRVSPVTWKVRGPRQPGTYTLKVESSTGAAQSQPLKIQAKGIFGSN